MSKLLYSESTESYLKKRVRDSERKRVNYPGVTM